MQNQNNKIELRPIISTIIKNDSQSLEEKFQNEILRPILKLQNDLIFCFFKTYLEEKKIKFNQFPRLKKIEKIEKIFNTDSSFKAELRGFIIGMLTSFEYKQYVESKKELNKRISTMAKERIISYF